MAEPMLIFGGATGVNNKMDPHRLAFDGESGFGALPEGYNVDIDDGGRVSRRKGYTKRVSGASHSLFCHDNVNCYFINATNLRKLYGDYTTSVVRSGLTLGARASYVQIGAEIYYTNGHENGVIVGDTSYSWTGGSYVGPTTYKTYSDPPLGHLLAHYNGRIMVAEGSQFWYSSPFSYSWFNLAEDFYLCGGQVEMIAPVKGGVYVSNDHQIFFLDGDYQDWTREEIAPYPAIRGTNVIVRGEEIGRGEYGERVALWLTREGVCLGGSRGQFVNLTERDLVLPSSNAGAGLIKKGKYICTMEP
jgi:hypothetical protein